MVRRAIPTFVAAVVVAGVAGAAPSLGARSVVPNWPYTVYRPANLSTSQKVPLLVYPVYGSVQQTSASEDFDAEAARLGFVVVWAQILKSYNDVVHAAGSEDPSNPNPDMLYISSVIDEVTASENIDPNRVFLTGMSASGTLSYRAACVLANKITGIAPVEAVVENPNCHPSRPISLFAINGTADPASPYTGGLGFPSVSTIMSNWRGYDSCPATTTTKTLSSTSSTTTWGPCQSGTTVSSTTVNGGVHGWPAVTGIARFDATAVISAWLMSVPGAASQPSVTLAAKLAGVTVKTGKPRKLILRLSSNLAASGKVTLSLRGKSVYSHALRAAAGSSVVALALPARLGKGTYLLKVNLASRAGAATLRRTIRIPA